MQVVLIALSTAMLLAGPEPSAAGETPGDFYTIRACLITLIQDVDVPAQEAGVLIELAVREGSEVSEGQVLAQIDDRVEQKLRDSAQAKLDVAEKEAENDISVRYAQAASAVAHAEVAQDEEARRRVAASVPDAEYRRKLLAARQADLQIEQSEHELGIAKKSVDVRRAELDVADVQIKRRLITAPLDGIVVERYVDVGEWVQPGNALLRLIRLNRVQIEGYVDATKVLPAQVDGQQVIVRLNVDTESAVPLPPAAEGQVFKGRIDFVSPIVEAGPKFRVRAEVDNVWVLPNPNRPNEGYWLLRPGLYADMAVSLRPIPTGRLTTRVEEQ